MQHPQPTKYFDDFLGYYSRAKLLEDRNHRGGRRKTTGDALQDSVSIYDTVHRRYAGFSNVLRDLRGLRESRNNPASSWDFATWLYVYGVHRMTGSGASFFPASEGERRHGYCNVICPDFAEHDCRSIPEMVEIINNRASRKTPMFTSHGNQPPPFPKPINGYETGGVYYFCEIWPDFAREIASVLESMDDKPSIVSMTDWVLDRNVELGCKRFKFTMTAFVMDIADWHPEHIDPRTQCHYGANALVAMNAMFSDHNRTKGRQFYDECMEMLIEPCTKILGEEACPMDIEDALCDSVRYWSHFVPRHGYSHLTPDQTRTLSRIQLEEFLEFCRV